MEDAQDRNILTLAYMCVFIKIGTHRVIGDYVLSAYDLSFTKVAKISEIQNGKMKMVKLNEKEILIVNVNASFFAISNKCIHNGGNLSEGSLDGKILTCPIHGSKFDVTTGKCIHRPRNIFRQAKTDDAISYELRLDDENILLSKQSPWSIS